MFSKLAIFAVATMALVASAAPLNKSCNTGEVQCCNKITDKNDKTVSDLFGLLGIVAEVTGDVGLGCSPLSAIGGIGGNSCSAQPVCCENNNYNGLVALGCSPINLNL